MGVVVLNYNNYTVTINCLNYILEQSLQIPVVIVDNGSTNNSVKILSKKFKDTPNIYILPSKSNIGFARGNNLGITFLKSKKCETIMLLNSDVFLTNPDFISNLSKYVVPDNIAVVGTEILDRNGKNQNPIAADNKTLHLYLLLINLWRLKLGISSFGFFSKVYKKFRKPVQFSHQIKAETVPTQILSDNQYLHGAALILTQAFFENFGGLYNKTFLYFEEPILDIGIKKAGLRMLYISELSVMHLEDQSSNTSFKQHSQQWFNYSIQGLKEFIHVKKLSLDSLKLFMKEEKDEPID